MKKYTPENITELKPNEVFVFGSNMNGNHAGGAARVAVEKFGAIMGQAEGLQGQSYAIPTLDKDMQKVDLDTLQKSLFRFCQFANDNQNKTFYLTKIGLGIAGFTLDEILSVINRVDMPDTLYCYQSEESEYKVGRIVYNFHNSIRIENDIDRTFSQIVKMFGTELKVKEE